MVEGRPARPCRHGHGRVEDGHGDSARAHVGVIHHPPALHHVEVDPRMYVAHETRQPFEEYIPAAAARRMGRSGAGGTRAA